MSLSCESVVRRRTSLSAKIFILVALLLGAGAALPAWNYLIEWHAQHRLWCLLALLVAGVLVAAGVGFRFGSWARGALLLGSALCAARIGAPFLLFLPGESAPVPATNSERLTFLSIALESPADVAALRSSIAAAPDLIAVRGGATGAFLDSLGTVAPPYQSVVVGEDMALIGRLPVLGEPRLTLGADASPGLVAEMRFPDGRLGLVAVLALPRLQSHATYVANRRALRRVATLARHASGPVIVAGDLGLPTNTPLFTLFTDGASLNDVAWGRGGRLPGDPLPLHRLLAHDHILVGGMVVDTITAAPWQGRGAAPLNASLSLVDGALTAPKSSGVALP